MKRFVSVCAALVLLGPVARAGVVVEMEVRGSDSTAEAGNETFYAQGETARMDPGSAHGGDDMSVIFRDQTMWFVDHDKKVCQKIDKAGLSELSSQLDAMMQQLASLPPEQRAMMEKMMKGKMPGMDEPPPRRIEVGAAEQVGDYPCVVHTVYSGEKKLWEVCTADADVASGISEAMDAFQAMSQFTEELQQVVRQGPLAAMIDTPLNEIDELGGFPVRVRTFDDQGRLVDETTLKSITVEDIEAAVFEVPKGYKVKDLQAELKKGR